MMVPRYWLTAVSMLPARPPHRLQRNREVGIDGAAARVNDIATNRRIQMNKDESRREFPGAPGRHDGSRSRDDGSQQRRHSGSCRGADASQADTGQNRRAGIHTGFRVR